MTLRSFSRAVLAAKNESSVTAGNRVLSLCCCIVPAFMHTNPTSLHLLAVLGFTAACIVPLRADTVLETETAELGKKGEGLLSFSTQFEKDKDGNKTAFTLNQIEYALTDRAEILIEPFFQEWQKPKGGKWSSGIGDLEITPSYMIILDDEKSWRPAVVLAFKLKVPTATNPDIGSGEFDYYPYVIFGKKIGHWLFNVNLGCNFITSPADQPLRDQFIYDFSVEREITDKWSVFAEVFGNSSPESGTSGTFAGAIATEYKFTKHFNAFISVGYDTDRLFNVRPGFNIEF